MKKSSFLIMILMITIRIVMAQQGENLVQNGTFKNGNVGFKSDFRYSYKNADSLIVGERFVITNNRFYYFVRKGSPQRLYNDSLQLDFLIRQNTSGKDSTGNFLLAWNNESGVEKLWYDSITIKPNTTYSFSCIVSNVYYSPIPNTKGTKGIFMPTIPGFIRLCVNGKKVTRWLSLWENNEWRTLSGTFTSRPDQTRIEISIESGERSRIISSLVAVDNVVFKEIQPEELVKEERFPKLGGIINMNTAFVLKEEQVVETPPVKEKEAIAVITPPVKKEEAVVEIPPVKEEEPIVEIPVVKEKESVTVVTPKPTVVTPSKSKLPVIPPRPKLPVIVSPKPKPPIIILPKPRPPVVILSKQPVAVAEVKPKDSAPPVEAVSSDFNKDILIEQIKVDQKLQLSNIYFERAKYNLLPASFPELNDLATFMKKHPTVRIRLEGHTDNQGNPKLNLELSENRVKEVKKYLVEQGIDDNRIEWIGYGGLRPMNSNSNEYLRQKNRRVEVVIIDK